MKFSRREYAEPYFHAPLRHQTQSLGTKAALFLQSIYSKFMQVITTPSNTSNNDLYSYTNFHFFNSKYAVESSCSLFWFILQYSRSKILSVPRFGSVLTDTEPAFGQRDICGPTDTSQLTVSLTSGSAQQQNPHKMNYTLQGAIFQGLWKFHSFVPAPMFILLQEIKLSDDKRSDWVIQDSISKET